MSSEQTDTQGQGEAGGGADDLSSALGGGGETEFVTGEEKKPANQQLLYLLLLVVIGGGVTFYMYKRQGPESAAASATPEAAKAKETINSFLTSGPNGIKAMQDMLKDTEKVVQQFNDYPSVKQTPLADLHTNPFRFAPEKTGTEAPDAEALKKKRDEEKQAAIRASEGLQLQTIIVSGSRKACMINNTLYSEGQQVDQFTVETIEKGRVIVKTGPYRFELKMQR